MAASFSDVPCRGNTGNAIPNDDYVFFFHFQLFTDNR